MAYAFLIAAIASEVAATLSLRASEGFTKLGFSAVAVFGYIVAFGCLSAALVRGLPLGVAYGIWAAAGVAAVAVLSVPLFRESLSAAQVGGLALVIAGIVAVELGGAH